MKIRKDDATGILSGTTYYIRYAETDYLNASPVQIITIGSFDPTKEPTPNGSFEASTMTLSGVESGQKYSINGGETWTEISVTWRPFGFISRKKFLFLWPLSRSPAGTEKIFSKKFVKR